MIKVNYDSITADILGYYPDNIGYSSIPEPNIEITEEQHQDCINNPGKRKVDITTLKIIECEAPTATPAQQNYVAVDSDLLNLAQAIADQEQRLTKLEGGKTV